MINVTRIIQCFSCIFCLFYSIVFADIIKNYHVDITVLDTGEIDVIETIELDIDHKDVRLGFVREIPDRYSLYKQEIETPIDVLSVQRNGQPENYWVEHRSGVVNIFTGARQNLRENYVPLGRNTYTIHWQSNNHIRGFTGYDELYINAIGTGWAFPIEKASATIHLPDSVQAIQSSGYYGDNGERLVAKTVEISKHEIGYSVPVEIGNGRGLTVAIGFTKGVLPSIQMGAFERLVEDALSYLPSAFQPIHVVLMAIVAVMFLYWYVGYCIYQLRLPRNDRVFMVRFTPPNFPLDKIMALESHRYSVQKSRFKLAFLVDLARKNIIFFQKPEMMISVDESKEHFSEDDLTEGQLAFVSELEQKVGGKAFYGSYNPFLEEALEKMIEPVVKYGEHYYHALIPGYKLIALVLFIFCIIFATAIIDGEKFLILVFPFLGTLMIWEVLFNGRLIKGVSNGLFGAVFVLFLVFVFSVSCLSVLWGDTTTIGQGVIQSLLVIVILMLFVYVLCLYSKISDCVKTEYLDDQQQVLEFKHFLQHTKEAEYHVVAPDLFEAYLPYAIAFGVDDHWFKLYQKLYPNQYRESQKIGGVAVHSISSSKAFSAATTSRSSGGSRGSGSGGGGSSGGGSGGGGGRGR